MGFRTTVSALALAMAASGASAAPMFTTTVTDGGDGTANFSIANNSDAGESIDSVMFSLGSSDLTFDSISNPSGTAVSNSTNSGDNELSVTFDEFTAGQDYSFNSVIRENDDDSVDSATDALFGNLMLDITSGGETFGTTVTSSQTVLPGDDMGGDNGDGSVDVPAPATLGLMALGLFGLATTRGIRS